MSALITPLELHDIYKDKGIKILDASYGLPPFEMGIEGAVDFDIDDIADPDAPFLHTLPSADLFADRIGMLGISNDDNVIVYDRAGIAMAASRAWWMFRVFGHDRVRVLDGGLPAWVNAGFPLSAKSQHATPAVFHAAFQPHLFKQRSDMLANIASHAFTVLDARDAARFGGMGHIPESFNLPYASLLASDGTLGAKEHLREKLSPYEGRKIACTCGSGVTACVIALALYELGHKDAAIYDGSWTEWGSDPALPKEKTQ